MIACQQLRDHPAHRPADGMDPPDAEREDDRFGERDGERVLRFLLAI